MNVADILQTWSEQSSPTRRRLLCDNTTTTEQDSGSCMFDYKGLIVFGNSKEGVPAFWHRTGIKLPLDMRIDCNALRPKKRNMTISTMISP